MEEEVQALLEGAAAFLAKACQALEAARAHGRNVDQAAAAVEQLAAAHAKLDRSVATLGLRVFAYQAHNLTHLQKQIDETMTCSEAADSVLAALRHATNQA